MYDTEFLLAYHDVNGKVRCLYFFCSSRRVLTDLHRMAALILLALCTRHAIILTPLSTRVARLNPLVFLTTSPRATAGASIK